MKFATSSLTSAEGAASGFDAGKNVKWRKRHLVVDTLGLMLAVTVTAVSVQDRDAAAEVLAQARAPSVKKLFADSAPYAGRCKLALEAAHVGMAVEVVRYPANGNTGTWCDQQLLWLKAPAPGFVVQAKHWVVERTHAWNERARRLVMHHDRSTWASVAWGWLTELRILSN